MADQPTHEPKPTEREVADAIPGVLTSLVERFREEERQTPLYRELAAQPHMTRRLRLAHAKMEEVVLALTAVLRDVDGIEITQDKYDLLKMLPLAKSRTEDLVTETEGIAGCVDKAFNAIHAALLNVHAHEDEDDTDQEEPSQGA
jgi:hypothetical protein